MPAQCSTAQVGKLATGAAIATRLLLAGAFGWAYSAGFRAGSFCAVAAAFGSDVLDGRLSRKFGTALAGGYLDAAADLVFVLVAFVLFASRALYAWWVVLLIGLMFAQFVATSGLRKPVYDPVGKYYGVFLYLATGITVLWPLEGVCRALTVMLGALTGVSLVSRWLFLRSGPRA